MNTIYCHMLINEIICKKSASKRLDTTITTFMNVRWWSKSISVWVSLKWQNNWIFDPSSENESLIHWKFTCIQTHTQNWTAINSSHYRLKRFLFVFRLSHFSTNTNCPPFFNVANMFTLRNVGRNTILNFYIYINGKLKRGLTN